MKSFFDMFSFLRSCAVCRGQNEWKTDFLCQYCWERVETLSRCEEVGSSNYGFPTYSLLKWTNNEDETKVSRLIYGLKRGHSPRVFTKLTQIFIGRLIQEDYEFEDIIFVPAPSKLSLQNHALYFAKALSDYSGYEIRDALETNDSKMQKKLSKEDRLEATKMWSREPWPGFWGKKVVFVDDVITTGATVQAAYRALGYPERFEAWTLAERLFVDGLKAPKGMDSLPKI